jgi:hypothetical protein
MRIGRPIPDLMITEQERSTLQSWARRPKSAQALALRAKIILACAAGKTNTEVAGHQADDRERARAFCGQAPGWIAG